MKSRRELFSPSSQKLGTLQSIGSTTSFETTMPALKSLHLQELYSKFLSANSQVQVQHDASAFNLLQYSGKVRQEDKDDQLRGAKLKKLENDAELRKIQQEIENRKKKVARHLRKELLIPQKHYMNTFQEIAQEKIVVYKQEPHTDSQDEGHGAETQRPKGLNYYNQLKKRPYLLKYTIQKVHSKEKAKLQEGEAKQQKIAEFKSGLKIASGAIRNRSSKSQINPQKAADVLFRRLYARKSKETPMEQLQNDTRTNRFKIKQDEVINKIDQHSLSRENLKKLKLKMAELAIDIYQDQKKHKSINKLPKIALSKTINPIQL